MNRLRDGQWAAGIFLIYVLAAIVATWPLVTELNSALPGGSSDTYMHYWNGWWVRKALSSGQSPYYTTYIFYPEGTSLVTHNMAWLTILPWLVVQTVIPDIAAYNVVLLLHLILCALSAFFLVYVLTKSRLASFVAGMINLTWPFRFSQLDHPNLISTYWLPLAMLFIVLWLRERRWWQAVGGGVSLALVGYTRWQMLIPAAFVVSVYLLARVRAWAPSRKAWQGLVLAAFVSSLLLTPPTILLANEWRDTIYSADTLLQEGEESLMQTDLLAYVTPTASHPVWGSLVEPLYETYYSDRSPGRRYPAYVGLVTAILAGIGLWRKRPESLPWLLVALTLVGLAAGAILRVHGQFYPQLPTLFSILEPLYFVKLIRVPDRFNVTLALPVAVMAGYGVLALLQHVKNRRAQIVLAGFLSALIFFEYLAIPIERQSIKVSPYYHQLAAEPSAEALLNLPFHIHRAKEYMFAQVTHGRPIVQGKAARIPPAAYSYIENHPLLRIIQDNAEIPVGALDVSRQLQSLSNDGIAALILHKFSEPSWIGHWQHYLPLVPHYEDDSLLVYSTAPRAGQDFQLLEELQPGIGPVLAKIANDCLHPGDVLAVDVAWGTSRALNRPYVAELAVVDMAGRAAQTNRVSLHADWPTGRWPADSLVWSFLTLDTSSLATGSYDVQLSLLPASEGQASSETNAIRLGPIELTDRLCNFDIPAGSNVADARFGNQVRLAGYQVERTEQMLHVTLSWRMMQHMETNYTVFVHVFEPSTGIPVAQDDSMPHRGGYPTRYWWAAEPVTDHITIELGDAPPGDYGLAVGVYDAETLVRLPLVTGDGQLVEDARFIIPDETVSIRVAKGE